MEKNIELSSIINDIIKDKHFMKLKYENHHGISRLDHSLNVTKLAFLIAKKLRMKNISDVTRAALLHDFFVDEELQGKINFTSHPMKASENAFKYFKVNYKIKNAIEAHMFPMSTTFPKYKESWIVTLSDKLVAIYECTRYKAPLKVGIYTFFLINLMTMPLNSR